MTHLEKFKQIDTFIFDVDGVLTDGRFLITEAGELLRSMNAKDGLAMKLALNAGYKMFIVTGGRSVGVIDRLKALGIQKVYAGVHDKLTKYKELLELFDLDEEKILYMGDDLPDYPVMRRVGMPCCPADAVQEVKSVSFYISPRAGGDACVRDVIEKVLKLNGDWPSLGTPDPFNAESA